MAEKQKPKLFQRKNLTKSITLFVGLALSILFFFILFYSGKIKISFGQVVNSLKPFIYGGVLAYILVPVCNSIQYALEKLFSRSGKMKPKTVRSLSNALSLVFSMLFAVLVIYLLIALILPELADSISTISKNFDGYYKSFMDWINQIFASNPTVQSYVLGIIDTATSALQNWLKSDLLPSATYIIGNLSSGLISTFSLALNLVIGIIISIYILSARKTYAAQCRILVHSIFKEKAANKIIYECRYAHRMFQGFISGRLLDSIVMGVFCFIGLLILRIPYPLLISVIVGVANLIPFFGSFIGCVPSALLLLLIDPMKSLWFIIFIIILQQVDGNIVGPMIIGEKTNLSGFWVLFAILLFGGLFGVVGMLIGVPLFSVIYHLIQELIMKGMKRTGYVPDEDEAEVSLLNAYLKKKKLEEEGGEPKKKKWFKKKAAEVKPENEDNKIE